MSTHDYITIANLNLSEIPAKPHLFKLIAQFASMQRPGTRRAIMKLIKEIN